MVATLEECATEAGLGRPTAVIFDEVWFDRATDAAAQQVAEEFERREGVRLNLSRPKASPVPICELIWRVRQALATGQLQPSTTIGVKAVRGESMYLPFALTQLFPDHASLQSFVQQRQRGPFTYTEIEDACGFRFSLMRNGFDPRGPPALYIIHEPRRLQRNLGHATALAWRQDSTAVYFDSCFPTAIEIVGDEVGDFVRGGGRLLLQVESVHGSAPRQVKRMRIADEQACDFRSWFAGSGEDDTESDEEPDGAVDVGPMGLAELTAAVSQERQRALDALGPYTARGQGTTSYECPFCVRRVFTQKTRLVSHITRDHAAAHGCKSMKQLRILKARWAELGAIRASDDFLGRAASLEVEGVLRQSALIMRSMLVSSPSFASMRTSITNYDDVTSWSLTEGGVCMLLSIDGAALGLRRVGNTYCSEGFLTLLLSMSIDTLSKGSARKVRDLLKRHFAARGCSVPFLLPGKNLIAGLQEVAVSKHSEVIPCALSRLAAFNDFDAVSVDGTYKFLRPVLGQPMHGARLEHTACRDDIHTVITARTMSGCIFWAAARYSEDPAPISHSLASIAHVKDSMRFLQVDRPRDWDKTQVRGACQTVEQSSFA